MEMEIGLVERPIDLVNRDPNNINDHVMVDFQEIIGEPYGVRSINCVWKHSFICFSCWRDVCYKLATFFCGVCIAIQWGCQFASVAVTHVWFTTPLLKGCEIQCSSLKSIYGLCVHCCCDSCCNSFGLCFGAFKKK